MAKKILVVDDHAPTRALIRAVLEREQNKFEIHDAASGSECLQIFDRKGPFDLVLLDVEMPDIDGFQVCRAIRNVDKRVPIVFVTGRTEFKDYNQGRDVGGDSYLVKPISRTALRSIVALFTSVERKAGGDPPSGG
jgi:two-component system response regulator ResD